MKKPFTKIILFWPLLLLHGIRPFSSSYFSTGHPGLAAEAP